MKMTWICIFHLSAIYKKKIGCLKSTKLSMLFEYVKTFEQAAIRL